LVLSGRTNASLKAGNSQVARYITDIKDLSIPLQDSETFFSGKVEITSADHFGRGMIKNHNLNLTTDFSLKKSGNGLQLKLSGSSLYSQDSLKNTVYQVMSIISQPHIAGKLAEKGINTADLDRLQKELYKNLLSAHLNVSSDITVNLTKDLKVKD